MSRPSASGAVVGLVVAATLLAGCTDDSSDGTGDQRSASLSADRSAAVLQELGAHPDALRAVVGPTPPGMSEPSVELDDSALDDLVAAGGNDAAAADFRASYLDYVRDGLEQAIRGSDESWYDLRDLIDEVWIDPSAEVLGAVEAGCDESGGTCSDRLDQADADLQEAVDEATYAAMPVRLLPRGFLVDGERVAMSDWTPRQRDDWQRLHDTTLLPLTTGAVEQATFARRQSAGA